MATGAGGTATVPDSPDGLLLGLTIGGFVLVATGGRLLVSARHRP